MSTARSLIDRSARIAGVLASGETFSGNEINEAFETFLALLSEWNINGFMQNKARRQTYSLDANTTDFIVLGQKPIISKVTYIGSDSSNEIPVRIVTMEEWASITDKSLTSPIPNVFYLEESDQATSQGYLWPAPSVDFTLNLWRIIDHTVPSVLDDDFDIESSENAFVHDLACAFCIEYSLPISPDLRDKTDKAKDILKRSNVNIPKMISDAYEPRIRNRRYNIYSGGR